jgi:hypothetical protein
MIEPGLRDWLADRSGRARERAGALAFAAEWAKPTPLPRLARALDALADPSAEDVATLLAPMLAEADWAQAVVDRLVETAAGNPFFEPPLAAVLSDVQAGLMLYAGRHAAIVLGVGPLDRLAAKKRRGRGGVIAFQGYETLIRVMKPGGARLSLWEGGWREGAVLPHCRQLERHALQAGETLRLDPGMGFLVEHAQADMVLLHATIFAGCAPTACDYDRDTLMLRGLGAASEQASRAQMLTTLLGALDRPDRAGFDAASRFPQAFARWHAMREWLALDMDAATPRLTEMAAADPDLELRRLAAETLVLAACPA